MIKHKKLLLSLTAAFLVCEATLGVLLQTAQNKIPFNLRYTAVILAFLFFFIFAERSLSFLFTAIALLTTVGADYFLVYLPEIRQLPAMIFFSFTQIAYFLRLFCEDTDENRKKLHLTLRLLLSFVALILTATVLGKNTDALSLVSIFYYTNLLLNTVFACLSGKKNPLFAAGLILFVLCDTVIGLIFVKNYLPLSPDSFIYSILYPGFDLAWAFYLPSQALLAISLLPKRLKRAQNT